MSAAEDFSANEAASGSVRILDAQSVAAIEECIKAAKGRGWTNEDLQQFFAKRGVTPDDWRMARDGFAVAELVANALAAVSVHDLPNKPEDEEGAREKLDGDPFAFEPDEDHLARFMAAVFKHADPEGFLNLRAFNDVHAGRAPIFTEGVKVGDSQLVARVMASARAAANHAEPHVFCPPTCTFAISTSAANDVLADGLVLSVDCDKSPEKGKALLTAVLGEPTIVVASGGRWQNPETGELEPKCHLYWRLDRPVSTKERHAELRRARELAARLIGADGTNIAIVHPIRWPGSWHRKSKPVLAQIVGGDPDREITLDAALTALQAASAQEEQSAPERSSRSSGPFSEAFGQGHKAPLEDIAAALDAIPNYDREWDDWNRIGMAAWRASSGAAFDPFDRWSRKAAKYDLARTRARWDHYATSPPDSLGAGTLFYEARRADPNWIKPSSGRPKDDARESAGKAGEQPEPIPTVCAASLAGKAVPPRVWLADQWIPSRAVTLLYGDGGTGKSTLALQLGFACATATDWCGVALPVPGPAIILSAEDEIEECHRRLAAISEARSIGLDELGGLHIIPRAGEDATLVVVNRDGTVAPTALYQRLRETIRQVRPVVVVLDNLADIYLGDENVKQYVRQCIRLLGALALEFDMAVVVLAHPSVAGMGSGTGTSGNVGWSNSVRSRLYFDRVRGEDGKEPDTSARVLKVMKSNYGASGLEQRLRWETGRYVPQMGSADPYDNAEAEAVFLALLAQANREGRNVSANRCPTHAPSVFSKREDACGISKTSFIHAMDRLFKAGKIAIETFGPASKPRTRLVLKGSV
jgi:RecA-family ATPase/nucleotide-binding universal stress UspA family protein